MHISNQEMSKDEISRERTSTDQFFTEQRSKIEIFNDDEMTYVDDEEDHQQSV